VQSSSLPSMSQITGYTSLSAQGQREIAARGATVDLSDSISASNLQALGVIRANATQREADISQLESASHSPDPAQHTEMATLQRINQALLIELRTQQETNQMLQAQALQTLVGQKVQQDNLKSLFQTGNVYQQNFNAITPQQSTAGTQLKAHGHISREEHTFTVLVNRAELTGADRRWASRYEVGDVLRYQRGSSELNLNKGSYVTVVGIDPQANRLSVKDRQGDLISYDPARVRGIDAYRETERAFSVGDRLQVTAPCRDLDLPNRALGTIESISVRMDSGRVVAFDPREMRHFDHGHAVTSHSSQGLTAERVLVNMDTELGQNLVNARFAYVSVSRASHAAEVFTNNANSIGDALQRDIPKTSAIQVQALNLPVSSAPGTQEIGVGLSN